MAHADLEQAKFYALHRLEKDLPADLTYHNPAHTRDDVAPAAERLAAAHRISLEDQLLLMTAVYFHDLGMIEERTNHEEISARLAGEILPGFDYSNEQIQTIRQIILATRVPHQTNSLLEEIIADADLDVLGREDFLTRNRELRQENAAYGQVYTDEAWYGNQLAFMKTHRYFTPAAMALRQPMKERHMELFARLAAEGREPNGIPMSNTAERVTILRSVGLFATTPDKILIELAGLLQPIQFKAGENIFQKGDVGDCLYIIVNGRVRVHDGELVFNYLGAADVFGEMAMLDSEPRSASVTSEEDTLLFRLEQGPFYSLMNQNASIGRGVITVLCNRLRSRVRDMSHDFEYLQQMGRISAAAVALEAGRYDARSLDEVCQRGDELGQLARMFQRMANEVKAREDSLKHQVEIMRIQIDEAKKARDVAEITESEYFQDLQQRVEKLRKKRT